MAYQLQKTINGSEIRHLQFSEFSEGHGSIYGSLTNGKNFKLHMSELLKMMDEFDFSVYKGSGPLHMTLKINWGSTNELRERKDFSYKSDLTEYKRSGNPYPGKVNYVTKVSNHKDTKFVEHRRGPYYSGNMIITQSDKHGKIKGDK